MEPGRGRAGERTDEPDSVEPRVVPGEGQRLGREALGRGTCAATAGVCTGSRGRLSYADALEPPVGIARGKAGRCAVRGRLSAQGVDHEQTFGRPFERPPASDTWQASGRTFDSLFRESLRKLFHQGSRQLIRKLAEQLQQSAFQQSIDHLGPVPAAVSRDQVEQH